MTEINVNDDRFYHWDKKLADRTRRRLERLKNI